MYKGLFARELHGGSKPGDVSRRRDFERAYAQMTIARVASDVAQLRRMRRAVRRERRALRTRGDGEVREEDDEADNQLWSEERALDHKIRIREREIATARRALGDLEEDDEE